VARGRVDIDGGLMRLAAQREGLIAEVFADEGDRVTAGQPLARLEDEAARLQLGIAEAELTQAEVQLALARTRATQATDEAGRLAPLARADAIPARQADEARHAATLAGIEARAAEIGLDLAQRRLQVQRQELEARTIRAPVAGVILRRSARPGDGTTTQTVTEMFLLAPDAPRIIRAELDEQFVGLVTPGQRAEIIRERDDGSRLMGQVLRVAPVFGTPGAAQADARTVEIIVQIDPDQPRAADLVLGQRMIVRILK
ncbi:MAG: HlyD family efflux transporter periplasmic adaptor subunit, partial [Paracoccus sp. (in: a-proteobacteria)]|nr:HlyD family efflux transporter periplasmic adaptor subunit [Paracoccus sp. (in: a-proteobacteria)]